MKYLFAHMCNLLSNDGKRVDKNTIWFEALLMLCLGVLAWVGTGVATVYFFIFNENVPIKGGSVVLLAVPYFIFYILLVRNKKYLKIWEKYEKETPSENQKGKRISLLFVFVPIVISMVMSLVWHNKI